MRVWTLHVRPEIGDRRVAAGNPAGPVAPPWRVPDAGAAAALGRAADLVLVREGFSWGAFLFGPVWLAVNRLWLVALATLLLAVALGAVLPAGLAIPAVLALGFLLGAHGRDLRRHALARRGYAEAGVVAERDMERALARLLTERPDLAAPLARGALA